MTKKNFIALADMLKTFNRTAELVNDTPFTESQINALANFCSEQNSNFNRSRWLGYIAGENGKNGGNVKRAGYVGADRFESHHVEVSQ